MKAKPKPKNKLSDLPPRPPQDLGEAVLFGALSEITPEVMRNYVSAVYRAPSAKTKATKMTKGECKSIFLMATVGFAFANWYRDKP